MTEVREGLDLDSATRQRLDDNVEVARNLAISPMQREAISRRVRGERFTPLGYASYGGTEVPVGLKRSRGRGAERRFTEELGLIAVIDAKLPDLRPALPLFYLLVRGS